MALCNTSRVVAKPSPTLLRLLLLIAVQSWCFGAAVDRCLSSPCRNHAACESALHDYLCHCPREPLAFTGKDCEELLDACASGPCPHGATCRSGALGTAAFTCLCPPGRTGADCETQAGRCASLPCVNAATCVDAGAGYSCVCPPGYTGNDCSAHLHGCASDPCQNGAVCRDRPGSFSCFCVPGYQGGLCEIEVDECASDPCRNKSTCLNKIDKYLCLCPPGLTGTDCEVEVDECSSQPCLNGGRCQDDFVGFTCRCAPGYTGSICETDLNECATRPCQNGGRCIDEANGYRCECVHSGYTGLHCDIHVLSCLSHPCLNAATCQDIAGNYTCHCLPGFTGPLCETNIRACSSNPCLRGGQCVELPWLKVYGNATDLPAVSGSERASGYTCKCRRGYTGSQCEMDVGECDWNPCQNGGTCRNTQEGYTCHCPAGGEQGVFFGGQNCTDILTGCESHGCQNKATCIPYLLGKQHRHRCLCTDGHAGTYCQLSTTFSFAVSGYLHFKTSLTRKTQSATHTPAYRVFLRCRTVLPNAIIFHRGNRGTFMKLEVLNGHLSASLQVRNRPLASLEIFKDVSDGEWHSVEVTLSSHFAVELLDRPCAGECTVLKPLEMESGQLSSAFESTSFGGTLGVHGDYPGATRPHFIGCLQDVTVDSNVLELDALPAQAALNVQPGCGKSTRCQTDPCQSRGQCVDLLTNYRCDCFRPYVGLNCSEELTPGRFGPEGYAVFTIDDNPGEEVNISMFVRSRKPSGLLLMLQSGGFPYLQLELDAGHVVAQSPPSQPLASDHSITDGSFHLITVEIKPNQMKLVESGRVVGRVPIPPVRVQAGDVAWIGGLPDQMELAQDTSYFEGCIQDIKINNKRLEFYPVGVSGESYSNRKLVNITSGCAGNNTCQFSPCLNGGICSSGWDDFVCSCPPNTSGKTCSLVQWCQLDPCPQGSQCHLLGDGFDCLVRATFKGEQGLTFRGNGKIKRDLTNVTFSVRTRESNAVVLHAVKEQDFITIGIQQCHLILMIGSGKGRGNLSILSSKPISDGVWHHVTLHMTRPSLQHSTWEMEVDQTDGTVTGHSAMGNLNFLREGADIALGSGGGEKAGSFGGCLGTVKLGGISLPYLAADSTHIVRPQQEQFIQPSFASISRGCPEESVCASDPCKNQGKCEDMVTYYHCSCPTGWTGGNCEEDIDDCRSSPCIHGHCTDRVSAYQCTCLPGYTGTNCEANVDHCPTHRCANGATCVNAIDGYSCRCTGNFTGRFCEYLRLSITFCNDEKTNWTCYNGGTCTKDRNSSCTCPVRFTGSQCEINVDECESSPCLNGGFCQNLPHQFQCICDMNFAGDHCQFDQ
ncbi:protein crumbs homolog 1 isoform X2 [Rhinoraja longicauda]